MKKHYDNLDLLKAAAILAVISLHLPLWKTGFLDASSDGSFIQYVSRSACEGVPVFVMINGFLLLKRKELDIRKHYGKVMKMIGLMMVWSVIMILFKSYFAGEKLTANAVLMYILETKNGSTYTGVLWFLQYLTAVYLVYPVLWLTYQKNENLFNTLFKIVFCFVIGIRTLNLLGAAFPSYADFTVLLKNYIDRFNPFGHGSEYLLFFMYGGILFHRLDWVYAHKRLLTSAMILTFLLSALFGYGVSVMNGRLLSPDYNYCSVFTMIYLPGLLAATRDYHDRGSLLNRLIRELGRETFGIYLLHTLVITVMNNCFVMNSFSQRLACYFVIAALSLLLTKLVRKTPVLRYLLDF